MLGPMVPVSRVASLVPSMTESVCALGARDLLVAVTRYCEEPAAELRDVPRVGGTKNPKLEKLAALDPDLVIVNTEENRLEDIAWLRARFRVLEHVPCTVVEASDALRELAAALDRDQEALPFLLAIEAQLAACQVDDLLLEPVRVFYPIWRKPWMGVGAGTYIRDVLHRAGAVNVCDDLAGRYPEVDLAWLRAQRVDLVVLPDEPWAFTAAERDELEASGEFPAGTAIQCASGKDFCWHGVRTASGLGAVRSLLRPHRRSRSAH